MLVFADTASSNSDTPMVVVLAVCAICNILLTVSQVIIIPFVRSMKTDVKELTTTLHNQQVILAQIQTHNQESSRYFESLEKWQSALAARHDSLNNKVTDLMLHLAAKGTYTPISIRTESVEGHP